MDMCCRHLIPGYQNGINNDPLVHVRTLLRHFLVDVGTLLWLLGCFEWLGYRYAVAKVFWVDVSVLLWCSG